jgi:hypothetical protein
MAYRNAACKRTKSFQREVKISRGLPSLIASTAPESM